MQIRESIGVALGALRTNKLRSILTTLGIVIGVMTVIGMMTIIRGINATVEEQFEQIGTNTFFVQKYPAVQTRHTRERYRNRKDIKVEHALAIEERATLVARVSPEMFAWGQRVRYGGERTNADVFVIGSNLDWQIVNGRFVEKGRYFQDMDIRGGRSVCLIGKDIVETIFPFKDPLDQDIRVGPREFRIIGVLEERGSIFGQSQDNMVVIPYTTFQKVYGDRRDISITIQAKQTALLELTIDEVIGILRVERKVLPGMPNDFEVITRDSLTEAWQNLSGVVFAAAVGIAMISLLVGGIGIMNIMLVSVTERTREIGIRKSIGAKKRDILWQFIVEAIILSAVGGLLGILCGVGLGQLIGAITPLPAAVPVWAVFVGLGFSSLVGLFFGIYPAAKAAKLDPIVALRFE
jgi:putative ABC transport system permease protein